MIKNLLHAVETANKYGYRIKTYQDVVNNPEELQILMEFSEYGFLHRGKRIIFLNADQPEKEIAFTLWHEIGHIILRTDDEDAADDYARKMTA